MLDVVGKMTDMDLWAVAADGVELNDLTWCRGAASGSLRLRQAFLNVVERSYDDGGPNLIEKAQLALQLAGLYVLLESAEQSLVGVANPELNLEPFMSATALPAAVLGLLVGETDAALEAETAADLPWVLFEWLVEGEVWNLRRRLCAESATVGFSIRPTGYSKSDGRYSKPKG